MKTQNQIRKDMEMRGEIGDKYKKTGNGRIETAEDFSVVVNSGKDLRMMRTLIMGNTGRSLP